MVFSPEPSWSIIASVGGREGKQMRAVSDGLLTTGLLTVAGYILQMFLPDSSVISVGWNAHQYYIADNVAAFWVCVALGVVIGAIQTIRVLLRDAGRLQ
jgi:hypothetical protein